MRRWLHWTVCVLLTSWSATRAGDHACGWCTPHYMVRTKTSEALDILMVCRKPCYTALFEAADALVAELRDKKIVPGTPAMPTALPPLAAGTSGEPAQAALPEPGPEVQASR